MTHRSVPHDRTDGYLPTDTLASVRVDIDGVHRADIDAQHTVDAGGLVRRIRLPFAHLIAGGVDPFKHVDRAVFEAVTRPVTDIEIHRHMRPVDAELGRSVHRSPYVMALVLVDPLACLQEVRVDRHTVPVGHPT